MHKQGSVAVCYQFSEQYRVFHTRSVLLNCFLLVPEVSVLILETLREVCLMLCTNTMLCLCINAFVLWLCFATQFYSRVVCQVYYITALY